MRIIDENSPSFQFMWDAKPQISHEFEAKYKKILGNDPGAKAGPFGDNIRGPKYMCCVTVPSKKYTVSPSANPNGEIGSCFPLMSMITV